MNNPEPIMEQNQPSVKTFDHEKFGQVRTVMLDDVVWFVGKDVAESLGYKLARKALQDHVPDKFKRTFQIGTPSGTQAMTLINEAGMYKLVLRSKLPSAEEFSDWLCQDVIPSIRKNGVYMTLEAAEKILYNPDFIIKLAQRVKDLSAQVQLLQPKADYCEKILQSEGTLPVTLIAKDYGFSARAFNQILAKYKIQHRCGNAWVINEPYSKMNYTKSVTFCPREGYARIQTQWTQKGRMFLYNTLKKCAILPVCERREPMEQII